MYIINSQKAQTRSETSLKKQWWKKLVSRWKQKETKEKKKIIIGLTILVAIFSFFQFYSPSERPQPVSYITFQTMLKEKKIQSVSIDLKSPTFTFTDKQGVVYSTQNPKTEDFKEQLLKHGIRVEEVDHLQIQLVITVIQQVLNLLFFLLLALYLLRSLPSSKTSKISPPFASSITFRDIAGNDEAKEEMKFLVDFLKNPKRFVEMGAKVPKGVIFYGPPGTGKTLMAKAIAGEAGVPFFSVSGSDFVEMFVGLGAKRIRDLFKEARKNTPCIIFIDEIDALGTNRDMNIHAEQRQTINAILKEMDGFESSEGILVIGATNRIEDLDPAFIRPGRFDKHIAINYPDQKARLDILRIHSRNKALAPDVSLEEVAKMTIGMTGAYLETLMNEAAILATIRNQKEITKKDIEDAFFKIVMKGHPKRSGDKRKDTEIQITAWHEAGHALVAKLLTNHSVHKVSIIPSTSGAGGVTFITPEKLSLQSKQEIKNQIKVMYGGRAAEYLLLGDEELVTTGAHQDIQQATVLIKKLISEYGMSPSLGMINLSQLTPSPSSFSDEILLKEASELSKKLYEETISLLEEHIHVLKQIADTLIEKETISEQELDQILQNHQIHIVSS